MVAAIEGMGLPALYPAKEKSMGVGLRGGVWDADIFHPARRNSTASDLAILIMSAGPMSDARMYL
jgi:hypothetical protein